MCLPVATISTRKALEKPSGKSIQPIHQSQQEWQVKSQIKWYQRKANSKEYLDRPASAKLIGHWKAGRFERASLTARLPWPELALPSWIQLGSASASNNKRCRTREETRLCWQSFGAHLKWWQTS